MLAIATLAVSFVLLVYAALRALRLIKVTGWRSPWVVLSGVALLQAARRASTLTTIISGGPDDSTYLTSALITLLISAGMVAVVEMIGPIFVSMESIIRGRTEELARSNDELQVVNEELDASNEAMQSIIAELDESNEELRVTNEELREAQARLKEVNGLLVEAQKEKDRFIAGVSHELRTPLNSIIGFSDLLLTGMVGPLSEEQGRQIGMIADSGKSLLAVINDILDIERAEAGFISINSVEVALADIVSDVAAFMEPQAAGKHLRLGFTGDRVMVLGDAERIRQIVINLVGNAVKFTATGGVEVAVTLDDQYACVRVTDTGPGIAAADLKRIFEEFVQLENEVAGKPPGTGLGLALSRRLARLMDGEVTAESTPGVGSSFTLTLPVAP